MDQSQIENYFLRQAEEHLNSMGFVGAVVKGVHMDDFGWPVFTCLIDGVGVTMRVDMTFGVPKFPKVEKICRFDGCDSLVKTLGYCAGHYRMHNQGLPMKPVRSYRPDLTPEEAQHLVRLVQEGYSVMRIGDILNISWSTVSRRFFRETGMSVKDYRKQSLGRYRVR
jgi:hypothetical protein